MIVTPGSQDILKQAIKLGYVETLMDAGAVVTNSTCGACFGGHMGLLADGEVCITASTRNFQGRMGSPHGERLHGLAGDGGRVGGDRRDHRSPRPLSSERRKRTMANTFTGKVWKFGDDINTDLVIPNFAVLMPVEEQLQHCFSANRPGWVDEVQPGDVLVAGRNFGVGSARNIGAVFHALGISGVVADSFNGLGLRNCINSGLPSLPCAGHPRRSSTRATSPRSTGRRARCGT